VRPGAEFLHVVAHGGHAAGVVVRGSAQKRHGIINASKRQQIAKLLQAGNYLHRFAALLGHVLAEELRNLAPGGEEVAIVDQRVIHSRFGQRGRQLRFPHALG